MTFRELAELWRRSYGHRLASAKNDQYRLKQLYAFTLKDKTPPVVLGDMTAEGVAAMDAMDIDAYRDFRKGSGLSAVTVNQDLRLIRKVFNWAIRKRLVDRTPFKINGETVIQLEREIPRHRRFEDSDDEQRLLAAASPHLHAIIVALLETACRVGEILSLQWADVSLPRRELIVRAHKAKTRTERLIPISTRLLHVMEIKRLDPAGESYGPEAYVFGDLLGRRVKSVRRAWTGACERAGLRDFQLRDLRHEAGSRFDEGGVPINFVSRLLGHTNLTTTSRYLNIHRRGLHMAMEKFEQSRRLAISLQDRDARDEDPATELQQQPARKSPVF